MDVATMTTVAGEWGSTALFAALLLGFLAALGRSGSRPANRPYDPASTFAQDALRGVLDGVKRLHELTRRRALPPWDDLDDRFPDDRGSTRADRRTTNQR